MHAYFKALVILSTVPSIVQAAQPDMITTEPPRLESPLVTTPRIEPVTPSTPAIPPRPSNDSPKMQLPVIRTEKIASLGPDDRQVQKELHRLQTQADAVGGSKSTVQAAQAAWLLGLIYLHGAGVRQDFSKALLWFERSARSGKEPWAYAGLAWCYIDGCGSPPEPSAATRAIAQLRAQHPARANFLTWLLASRFAPSGAPGPQTITPAQSEQVPHLAILQRSAAAGDTQALMELGMIAVAQNNHSQAEEYFRRAMLHSPAAQNNLQELRNRSNAPVDKQADAPNSEASEALTMARKYHRGQGVPANFTEAIRFYRLADARGSVDARRMLALIYSRPQPDGSINPGWMQQLANVDPHTPIPSVGPSAGPTLQRDPTPLYDLLPAFWRRQIQQISR